MTETQADANQRDGKARTSSDGEHIDDLAEAYALGALDDHERRHVDHHLATCLDCRALVDDLHRVTALLPFTAPLTAEPSPTAKASLLARVQQTDRTAHPAATSLSSPARPPSPTPARAVWPRWGSVAVPAALTVLLVSSLVWSWSLSHKLDAAENQRDTYHSQLTWLYNGESGARIYAFQPMRQNSGAGGRLCVDGKTSNAMVVAWSLDPSRQHVLWEMHANGTRTELMPLNVSASGNVVQMVSYDPGQSGDTTLMIATDGPDSSMELMLKPTQAPPSTPAATSWPYNSQPVPLAF